MKYSSNFVNEAIDTVFDWFSSIVGNVASNIAPLAAGVLPAYMTWIHIVGVLDYPTWVAWSGALVVEFLGLGAGQELMEVWNHNRKYKDEKIKMPVMNSAGAAIYYVLIMVVFNVILEAFPDSTPWKIASQALFATLAIPGYALVSAKTLRKETQRQRSQEIAERREERQKEREAQAARSLPKPKEKEEEQAKRNVTNEIRQYLKEAGILPSEVGDSLRYKPAVIADELQLKGTDRSNIHTILLRLKREESQGKFNP